MTDLLHSTKTVEDMLRALAERDVDHAAALLDDAIVWHNVGFPKVRGIARVRKALAVMAKPNYGFDVTSHNIAATPDGDVVLTERTDVLIWRRLRVEFWVYGTFELRDDRILVWRDYFDNLDFAKGLVRGLWRLCT
ncbi:limonene-1,2-epoxide hydrolase family protein [Rhodococcus sp. 1168]|uniref:limonene-1,2-epoxide hydrolase family protein n=1 Tax=Rhodococcus sp. 1168 TaxID=2018041 RepID=UPI000B5AC9CF|nr:limonene-1,2-epoxide hydrolase family protein [Rhodococcus sp. 1168]